VALDSVRGRHRRDAPVAREAKRARDLDAAPRPPSMPANASPGIIFRAAVKRRFTVEIDQWCLSGQARWSMCDRVRTPRSQGKPLEFKVIKLDQKRNNVSVAPRGRGAGFSAERSALMTTCRKGRSASSVKNLTDYGAFSDLAASTGRCTSPGHGPGSASKHPPRSSGWR